MQYDVIISGAGIVGSTLACLLGRSGLRVAVIEPMLISPFTVEDDYELRVSAISKVSQQQLAKAGAWPGIMQRRVSRYSSMVVWDATGSGEIRFDARELGESELGHIIENKVIQLALLDVMEETPTIDLYCPGRLVEFRRTDGDMKAILEDGVELEGQLLVGADGANSKVREMAGIAWNKEDYAQKGLVCVAKTSAPHQATAWQRFMPGGPLAFLPLPNQNYCSIVWTLPADSIDVALKQDDVIFRQQLGDAVGNRLGTIESIGVRAAFPLYGAQAENYVQDKLALIGDAAHSIHPLAGQGVNLGIKDASELASQLINASGRLNSINLGSLKTLRRYERARRGDNLLTRKAMEGFSLLFGNTSPALQFGRNQGLSMLNQLPSLKNALVRRAMGG